MRQRHVTAKACRAVRRALLILSACAGVVLGKGSGGYSGGSSSSGGYSSSSSYSSSYSSGKMRGSSWPAHGSGRTAGGSRVYVQDDDYYSSGPRTYYGGTGQRGPRYYNNRAIAASAVVVTAAWASGSYGRYDFYDRNERCSKEGYFRFGRNCKKCSTPVCPDGQYRVQCGGGSDGYCTRCDNGCGIFNTDPEASTGSEPKFGVCMVTGSACYPYQSPTTCAYTSEGSPGKNVSDCQIESCCIDCKNDDEAKAKGKGTVCRGSTVGLANPGQRAILRFDGELPLLTHEFNEKGYEYRAAISSVAGGAQVRSAWVTERDPADVIPYRGSQLKHCLVGFEIDAFTG